MKRWLACAALVIGLSTLSYALSPWTSQPQTAAPVQGLSMRCNNVAVSSVTATQILASNATREGLYIANTSTFSTGGYQPNIVFISTWAVVAGDSQGDYGAISAGVGMGVPIWASNYQLGTATTTVIQGPTTFSWQGSSTWQGAVYGLATRQQGRVSACELNP